MFCAWCGNQVVTVSYAPCPRCGRPTNGAQTAPPTTSGGGNTAVVIIAVVVGGLFVVAIIGILAAIAIPNFITAKSRAQQKRTMADMRSIGAAIEAYKADNNGYPNASSIEALSPMLAPKYISNVPEHDGWSHPLMYFCYQHEEGHCSGYVLGSGGRDGMFEHSEPAAYVKAPEGGTKDFNCDLIFADGEFIEYPEGTQH